MILYKSLVLFLFIYVAKGEDIDVDGYLLDKSDRLYDEKTHMNYVITNDGATKGSTAWWKEKSTNATTTLKPEFMPIPAIRNITSDVAEQILSDLQLFNNSVSEQIKSIYGEHKPERYNETSQLLLDYLTSIKTRINTSSTSTRKTIRPFTEWQKTEATEVVEEDEREDKTRETNTYLTSTTVDLTTKNTKTIKPFTTLTTSKIITDTNNETTTNNNATSNNTFTRRSFEFPTRGNAGSLVDGIVLPTTTTQHPIVIDVLTKIQNKTYGHGALTGFLVKLLEIIQTKSYEEQAQLTMALEMAYSIEYEKGLLAHMGEAAKILMRKIEELNFLPPDVVRSQAIWAKEMLEHKDKYLAEDTNDIINKFNKLYSREQAKNLINVLPIIYEYPKNKTLSAKDVIENMLIELLLPYYKASETTRLHLFKAVNEALEKRRIFSRRRLVDYPRRSTKKRLRRRRPGNFGKRGRILHDRGGNMRDRSRNFHDRERFDESRTIKKKGGHISERGSHFFDRSGSSHEYRHFHDKSGNFQDRSRNLHHREVNFHDRSLNIDDRSRNIEVDVVLHHSEGHSGDRSGHSYDRIVHYDHRHDKNHDRIRNLDDKTRHFKNREEHYHDTSRNFGGKSHAKRHFHNKGENIHDINSNSKILHHGVPHFIDKSRNVDKSQDDESKQVKVKDDITTESPVKIKLVVKSKKDDIEKQTHEIYEKYEKPIIKSTNQHSGIHTDTEREYEYTSFSDSEYYETSIEAESRNHKK